MNQANKGTVCCLFWHSRNFVFWVSEFLSEGVQDWVVQVPAWTKLKQAYPLLQCQPGSWGNVNWVLGLHLAGCNTMIWGSLSLVLGQHLKPCLKWPPVLFLNLVSYCHGGYFFSLMISIWTLMLNSKRRGVWQGVSDLLRLRFNVFLGSPWPTGGLFSREVGRGFTFFSSWPRFARGRIFIDGQTFILPGHCQVVQLPVPVPPCPSVGHCGPETSSQKTYSQLDVQGQMKWRWAGIYQLLKPFKQHKSKGQKEGYKVNLSITVELLSDL